MALCSDSIKRYKETFQKSFDYIISTREDIIVLKEMNLTDLLSKVQNSKLSRGLSNCDLLSKDCLSWGGINIRFWILSEQNGLNFLSSKITFYKELIRQRRKIFNPEQYDAHHKNVLGLNHCGISINDFPVTAARHTFGGNYCFIDAEIDGCKPNGLEHIINSKMC